MSVADPRSIESEVARAWPPAEWRDLHVVLAVSGGPDSVAMLRALLEIKGRDKGRGQLFVAHLNHGLRGCEADADRTWLTVLCQRFGLTLRAETADVSALAGEQGDGWEAAARSMRYEFLTRVAEEVGARWVAVGHNRDDQVETVLHRLIRGTGVAGLAGMPRVRPLSPSVTLARPLLNVPREDVLAYLREIDQDYRVDATNEEARFMRNRLRHRLLPQIRREYCPEIDGTLLQLAQQAAETQQLIDGIAAELSVGCVEVDEPAKAGGESGKGPLIGASGVRIDCRGLCEQPPLLVREVCRAAWRRANWPLQAMGFEQWQQLATLSASRGEPPAISLPGGVRAEIRGGILRLTQGGGR
jgi:tRNA(Ile)-lysidine synthase